MPKLIILDVLELAYDICVTIPLLFCPDIPDIALTMDIGVTQELTSTHKYYNLIVFSLNIPFFVLALDYF